MQVSAFSGLNNVTDPLRLGVNWLARADNINITDTGGITKREGYSRVRSGNVASAFSTDDFSRLYLSVDSYITTFDGTPLHALASAWPISWCEVNDQVLFDNGTDSGIIQPDNTVLPWRDSLLTDIPVVGADGEALDSLYSPLPSGTRLIQHWRGRIYAAQYMPTEGQTVVWFSQPLGFHLFNLDSDFLLLPGRVDMLAPHNDALLVGTDSAIYAYTGDALTQLADYGVPPGQHWVTDDSRVLFWSQRGVCAALPFRLLTERQVSVAPGIRAGACLVQRQGQKRYLAAIQQGGQPFNAF
jgi:hypothetical protein